MRLVGETRRWYTAETSGVPKVLIYLGKDDVEDNPLLGTIYLSRRET